MEGKNTVSHDGIVEGVSGKRVRVRFVAHSACAACKVKGVCSVAESAEKFVEVDDSTGTLVRGDRVEILLEQKQGMKAVLFGYGLPLILLLVTLFSLIAITGREGLSALLALASLVPYYLLVYLFRNRISREFGFRLRRKV